MGSDVGSSFTWRRRGQGPAYPDQVVHSEGATFLFFNGRKVVAYFTAMARTWRIPFP